MAKRTTPQTQVLTLDILRVELGGLKKDLEEKIDGVEKRLDAKIEVKIDDATQSFKEYVDSHMKRIDMRFERVDRRFDKIEKQAKTNRDGLVDMIQRQAGEYRKRIDNHEQRITTLEARS
ncbi:MAG: hypothetical protein HY033_13515 [Ignavibacteriae bacterium]|nr:hypothetical protein [Ignavibacteria bacterium]MBI3365910.1 hypothetical protein [Ignavibacteriota bacterium]